MLKLIEQSLRLFKKEVLKPRRAGNEKLYGRSLTTHIEILEGGGENFYTHGVKSFHYLKIQVLLYTTPYKFLIFNRS